MSERSTSRIPDPVKREAFHAVLFHGCIGALLLLVLVWIVPHMISYWNFTNLKKLPAITYPVALLSEVLYPYAILPLLLVPGLIFLLWLDFRCFTALYRRFGQGAALLWSGFVGIALLGGLAWSIVGIGAVFSFANHVNR
jgi:hypothetical protein